MNRGRVSILIVAAVMAAAGCTSKLEDADLGANAALDAELDAANQRIQELEAELAETDGTTAKDDDDEVSTATEPPTADAGEATTKSPNTSDATEPVGQGGASAPDSSPYVGSFGDVSTLDLPAGASGEVAVIAQTVGLDQSGSLPMVVRNNTNSTISNIEVTGRARVDGTLAATGSSQGFEPAIVAPGEVAFGYVYFDFDAKIDGAEFELSLSSDDGPGYKLPATIEELVVSPNAIVGVVANPGGVPIIGPIGVSTACFDAAGNLSGYAQSYTDEDEIPEDGGSASFSIDLYDDAVPCEIGLVAASGYDF